MYYTYDHLHKILTVEPLSPITQIYINMTNKKSGICCDHTNKGPKIILKKRFLMLGGGETARPLEDCWLEESFMLCLLLSFMILFITSK